jgi:anti-sigma factor RsiW
MVDHPPGWTCERTVLQLEYYLSSTLPLAEALAVAEHVEACTGCAERLVLFRVRVARLSRG